MARISSQSPRAKREGNRDPNNIDSSEVQLDQDPMRKTDSSNEGVEWDNESYNSPYEDGGGIYSRRR
jgi:hypothetical protein